MTQEFYSNGKLLISGEYVILDGAVGLALPTKFGQSLRVTKSEHAYINWKSLALDKSVWFEAELDSYSLEIRQSSDLDTARTLQKILRQATKLNHKFLYGSQGYSIESYLDFDRSWGLGSSSTLMNNIAQWAEVDAFQLLWNAFSGSGYDIACAQNNTPIKYHLNERQPIVEEVEFNPTFKDSLYFIHLNEKQNSREGIAQYRNQNFDKAQLIERISDITRQLVTAKSLSEFESLLSVHENLIADGLKLTRVKDERFSDYTRSIKSLGAWGGDFILATGNKNAPAYFKSKGYDTVIPYAEMIL
ncbi:GHMP kinase [Maribacter algarum]|uniref:GHMP kinase n=1 Tax=Maribacter algarum (ex Zhang et al. 2020) TaxID=2578118 RepID=A0A5S3PWR9_9FLAO|nr:GYDIA family GHMP kinase [Maribacter algarum]TMM59476.1 GHMP kinase [Maribacter algarum]